MMNNLKATSRISLLAMSAALVSACATDRYAATEPSVQYVSTVGDPYAAYGTTAAADPYDPYSTYEVGTSVSTANLNPADFRGVAGARAAHRLYPEITAERLDGHCESVTTVAYGDTLSEIAEYCDTTVTALIAANPGLRSAHDLHVGQRLAIPNVRGNVYDGMRVAARPLPRYTPASYSQPTDTDVYVVRPGDTLSEIAALHGTTVRTLRLMNPRVEAYDLQIGERILVPEIVGPANRRVLPTDRLAERRSLPSVPHTRIDDRTVPQTNNAPVVIYINPASRSAEGSAVIAIDTDGPSETIRTQRTVPAPRIDYRDYNSYISNDRGHLNAVPATRIRYQSRLPQDGRDYRDLGTACMTRDAGEVRIIEASNATSGPRCTTGKPVRVYRPSS